MDGRVATFALALGFSIPVFTLRVFSTNESLCTEVITWERRTKEPLLYNTHTHTVWHTRDKSAQMSNRIPVAHRCRWQDTPTQRFGLWTANKEYTVHVGRLQKRKKQKQQNKFHLFHLSRYKSNRTVFLLLLIKIKIKQKSFHTEYKSEFLPFPICCPRNNYLTIKHLLQLNYDCTHSQERG